jgi:hypothetical protein
VRASWVTTELRPPGRSWTTRQRSQVLARLPWPRGVGKDFGMGFADRRIGRLDPFHASRTPDSCRSLLGVCHDQAADRAARLAGALPVSTGRDVGAQRSFVGAGFSGPDGDSVFLFFTKHSLKKKNGLA